MSTSKNETWRHRKRISDEEIFRRIREAQQRLKRVPRVTDFPDAMRVLVRKRFGRWQNAITLALGLSAERHYWSDEELLNLLRALYNDLGRFPEWADVRARKKSLTETIRTRFGGLNAALEKAVGDSPRLQLLTALQKLTPPGCDVATTQEIVSGRNMTAQRASVHLVECERHGWVTMGKYSTTTWWKLTPKGREFLRRQSNGQR